MQRHLEHLPNKLKTSDFKSTCVDNSIKFDDSFWKISNFSAAISSFPKFPSMVISVVEIFESKTRNFLHDINSKSESKSKFYTIKNLIKI